MQNVSEKWLETQTQKFLPPCDIAISFYDIDENIKGYTDTSYTTSAFGNIYQQIDISHPYNIYFNNGELLNGKRIFMSLFSDNYYMGQIDIKYYDNEDQLLEEISIDIKNKNCDTEIPNFNNDNSTKVYRIKISGFGYNSNIWITKLNIETLKTFTKNDIISCDFSQSGDLLSFELPHSEFSFELDNTNEQFNPDNPNNSLQSLINHELIYVDIIQHFADGTSETIKGGEYFIDGWDVSQNGITAKFTASDGLQFMTEKDNFVQNVPMYDNHYRIVSQISLSGTDAIRTNIGIQKENLNSGVSIYLPFTYNDTGINKCIIGAEDDYGYFWFGVNSNGYFELKVNNLTCTTTIQAVQNQYYKFHIMSHIYPTMRYENDVLKIFWDVILYVTYYNSLGESIQFTNSYEYPEEQEQLHPIIDLAIGGLNSNYEIQQATKIIFYNNETYGFPNLFIDTYSEDEESFITNFEGVPAYDTDINYFGLYNIVNSEFNFNDSTTGDNSEMYLSLYDTAYFAFINSNIPLNPDNTNRFFDISTQLKQYQNNANFNNIDCSLAETVQYCCNASKSIWYWDRNCQSHIVPFETSIELPKEYLKCDYIRFSGGQYIDTNIVPTNHTLYLNFMYENFGVDRRIFGTNGSISQTIGRTYYYALGMNDNTSNYSFFAGLDNDQIEFGNSADFVNKKINLVFNGIGNNKISLNKKNYVLDKSISETSYPLTFGGYAGSYDFVGLLFDLKIYNKTTKYLERDLIPCIKKSDGVCGFYDLIRKEFLINNGSGTLSCNYNYRGTVQNINLLPENNNNDNDIYITVDTNIAYVWKQNQWQEIEEEKSNYDISQFNSFRNAEYDFSEELSAVNVNDGLAIYNISNNGIVQTIDNPFITDADHAFEIAKWIADVLLKRKTLNGEFRPDTRLDIYDLVKITNKYSIDDVYITSLKYSFNGAFKGEYEGKSFKSEYIDK